MVKRFGLWILFGFGILVFGFMLGCADQQNLPEVLTVTGRSPALNASSVSSTEALSATFKYSINKTGITASNLFSTYLGYHSSHTAGTPQVSSISWSPNDKTLTASLTGWSGVSGTQVYIVPRANVLKDAFGNVAQTSLIIWKFSLNSSVTTSTTSTTNTSTTTNTTTTTQASGPTISGTAKALAGDVSSLSSSGIFRIAAADTYVAVPSATVRIGTINSAGTWEPVVGLQTTTASDGSFSIQSSNIEASKNYIIQISKTTEAGTGMLQMAGQVLATSTSASKEVNPDSTVMSRVVAEKVVAEIGSLVAGSVLDNSDVASTVTIIDGTIDKTITKLATSPSVVVAASAYKEATILTGSTSFNAYVTSVDTSNTEAYIDKLVLGKQFAEPSSLTAAQIKTKIKNIAASFNPQIYEVMVQRSPGILDGLVTAVQDGNTASIQEIFDARAATFYLPSGGAQDPFAPLQAEYTNSDPTDYVATLNTTISAASTSIQNGTAVNQALIIAFGDKINDGTTLTADEQLNALAMIYVIFDKVLKPAADANVGVGIPVLIKPFYSSLEVSANGVLRYYSSSFAGTSKDSQSITWLSLQMGLGLSEGDTFEAGSLVAPDGTQYDDIIEIDPSSQGKQYLQGLTDYAELDIPPFGSPQDYNYSQMVDVSDDAKNGIWQVTITTSAGATYIRDVYVLNTVISGEAIQNLAVAGSALNDSTAVTVAEESVVTWDSADMTLPSGITQMYYVFVEVVDASDNSTKGLVFDMHKSGGTTSTSYTLPKLGAGTYRVGVNVEVVDANEISLTGGALSSGLIQIQ